MTAPSESGSLFMPGPRGCLLGGSPGFQWPASQLVVCVLQLVMRFKIKLQRVHSFGCKQRHVLTCSRSGVCSE